jgi:glycosyltransferase involved in cell wall biosynthesis
MEHPFERVTAAAIGELTTSPGVTTSTTNGAPAHPQPAVTIVVPTRNEERNVSALVERLDAALRPLPFEIVFVDDSDDDTPRVIAELAIRRPHRVRLLHRPAERRADGLGGAVLEGVGLAHAPWICVMDGDLQHPPEVVPELLERAAAGDVDMVVASRFRGHRRARGLALPRRIASHGLIGLTRAFFPRRLRGVSDPLTGFFLVRTASVDASRLHPRGFKILLEMLARTPGLRVAEIGFTFGERLSGDSKASLAEARIYLSQLVRLRLAAGGARALRFGTVGASGILVNTALLAFFTEVVGVYWLLSAVLATQGSSLWNFALTERWVFRERRARAGWQGRCLAFLAMNNAALLVRGPLLALLAAVGMQYLLANVVSLLALTAARFAAADGVIWRERDETPARRAGPYSYSIHDIVSVVSDVRLPEIARFAVESVTGEPTIRVRCGRVRHLGRRTTRVSVLGDRLVYREGTLGFGVQLDMHGSVDIVASPLLRFSPHVLYTNIVEPVLRWTFVQRGYALVHAACLAFDDDALLVTARTDTGKTTTVLKTLDTTPCAFVSDDLTLIRADGRVLPYPKPLTISSHTVSAVKTPMLRRRERAFLPIQSRLHSRGGRRAGLAISRSRLPAATMNAIVQAVIPPPKYDVTRLVAGVQLAPSARLAGLVLIERDGDGRLPVAPYEALETLMRNCDDAYTFPPYPAIEAFLHSRGGADLRAVERSIVAAALDDVPATLLRSARREWSTQLPSVAAESALLTRRARRQAGAPGTSAAWKVAPTHAPE